MIEFDVETEHLQWTADAAGLHLVAFEAGPDPIETRLCAHPADRNTVQKNLEQPDGYRGWNTKFDLHVLKAADYKLPPEHRWHDGMVAAHIMDERTSVALKNRAERLFGPSAKDDQAAVQGWLKEETKRRRAASKDTGEEFVEPNFSDVPDEIMHPYAKGDVGLTRQIGDVYDPSTLDGKFKDLYSLEMDVMRGLFTMEERGIPMDPEAMVALEGQLLDQLEVAEGRCVELSGFDNFNPRSPKQISEALDRQATKAELSHVTRTGSGQLRTDEENMEACEHPLSDAILTYRGEHKLYAMVRGIMHTGSNDSKFPEAYLTSEDRVHPNFRQIGARTGRMSCSNPNFQQIHRDDLRLRYAVAAGPGKKLVCCDLDSIELRLLAAFVGEGALRDEFHQPNPDPHTRTAKLVGLTGRTRSTGAVEGPRAQGKRMNYLICYGGGVRAIMKWFLCSQSEARSMMQRMHAAYPEISTFQNTIELALEDHGHVKSPLTGRHFRLQTSIDREGYKFLNYLIQGTAADVMKIAVARCHEAGVPMVAAVHDEIIAEVDEADAEECARIIERAFTDFPEISAKVPVLAEADIVDRWSQVKDPDYVPDYLEAR